MNTTQTAAPAHTPGPWFRGVVYPTGIQIVACQNPRYPDEPTTLIATVNPHTRNPGLPDEVCEEIKANARLIASAPALVEALKELEPFIAGYCEAADAEDPAWKVLSRTRAALRAAGVE